VVDAVARSDRAAPRPSMLRPSLHVTRANSHPPPHSRQRTHTGSRRLWQHMRRLLLGTLPPLMALMAGLTALSSTALRNRRCTMHALATPRALLHRQVMVARSMRAARCAPRAQACHVTLLNDLPPLRRSSRPRLTWLLMGACPLRPRSHADRPRGRGSVTCRRDPPRYRGHVSTLQTLNC